MNLSVPYAVIGRFAFQGVVGAALVALFGTTVLYFAAGILRAWGAIMHSHFDGLKNHIRQSLGLRQCAFITIPLFLAVVVAVLVISWTVAGQLIPYILPPAS